MVHGLATSQDKISAPARNKLVIILPKLTWLLGNKALLQAHSFATSYYWLEIKCVLQKRYILLSFAQILCLIKDTHYLQWLHWLHVLIWNMTQSLVSTNSVVVLQYFHITNRCQSMSYNEMMGNNFFSGCLYGDACSKTKFCLPQFSNMERYIRAGTWYQQG